jgi:hypothetical protein
MEKILDKQRIEAAKKLQSIEESRAKAAVMNARARKTEQEAYQQAKDSESISSTVASKADQEAAKAKKEQLDTAIALETREETIRKIKAKTLDSEKDLSSIEKERLDSYTSNTLGRVDATIAVMGPRTSLSPEELSSITEAIKNLETARMNYNSVSKEISNSAKTDLEYYQDQTKAIKEAADIKRVSAKNHDLYLKNNPDKSRDPNIPTIAQIDAEEKRSLANLETEMRQRKELSTIRMNDASRELEFSKQNLQLTTQKVNLESQEMAKRAKDSIQQSRAISTEAKARADIVEASIIEATREDVIRQSRLKTLQREKSL